MAIFEIFGEQKTLTQWDMGRRLVVPEGCNQVHYANAEMSEALVCQVTEQDGVRTAIIPDEVLQVSGTLWVYAYREDTERSTRHIQTFFVKERPKPADYVYTPTQWVTMEALLERMDALEMGIETDPTVPDWAKQAQKPSYTAEEVGARAANWMPTASEVGARAASWMPTAAEVGARASTWLPAITEIGAAPDGYGLGTAAPETVDSCDEALANGWYCAPAPSGYGLSGSGLLLVSSFSGSYKVQAFYHSGNSGVTLERFMIDGVWQPFEWKNPPLVMGQEYRTTERFRERPVYVKLVDCGSAADGKQVEHGIENPHYIIRYQGFRNSLPMPQIYSKDLSNVWTCYVSNVDKTKITLACGTSAAGGSVQVILWYTKTTE